MSFTQEHESMLETLVRELPPRLDRLFEMDAQPDEEKGACTTYSRILAEVLGEFGITAEVRPVFIITANKAAIEYREGKIGEEEAKRRGDRIQFWGDIRLGQTYQHAVCYIPQWDVIVDLGMARRASGLVPSHPYWAESRKFPWWLQRFAFMTYPLEYAAYETMPEEVGKAREMVRQFLQRYLPSPLRNPEAFKQGSMSSHSR